MLSRTVWGKSLIRLDPIFTTVKSDNIMPMQTNFKTQTFKEIALAVYSNVNTYFLVVFAGGIETVNANQFQLICSTNL